jgi:hypothetical protein
LTSENLGFPSGNLLAKCCYFSLRVVVGARFIIQVESCIIDFFLESLQRD